MPDFTNPRILLALVIAWAIGIWMGRISRDRGPTRSDRAQTSENLKKLSADGRRQVDDLLEKNQFIAAIKVARADLGIGLKEAKHLVEQIRDGP